MWRSCNQLKVYENIIIDTAAAGITVYADRNGGPTNIMIERNIVYGSVGGPIRVNEETGNGTGNDPFTVSRRDNIVESNPLSGDHVVSNSTFIGPLDQYQGFAAA